jgi:PAS domain S-box-containing protein
MERGFALEDTLARKLVEASQDGLVVVDTHGTIVMANPATEAMFGWPAGALAGEPIDALLAEEHRAAHAAHREQFVRNPRPHQMGRGLSLRGRRRDGSAFPIEVTLGPIETPQGSWVVASVRDLTAREHAASALERSEQRLRELIEQAPDGVFVADLEGRYTDVNAAACEMLGYSRDELVGKTIMDVIPPEEVPRLAATKQRLLEPGAVDIAEWTLRRKDGHRLAVEVSTKILADGRWQAFVRDISERKRADQALRTAEDALRRAQAVARLGSWDWDLRTNTIYRSPELYALYGIEPGAQAPFALTSLVPEEERHTLRRTVEEAVRTGRSYKLEHRIVRPDGEERILLQQGETSVVDGVPVRCVGTTLDITELRKAEREGARLLSELTAVLEECPVGITIVRGAHAEKLEPNRQARAMQGDPFDPEAGLSQYSGTLLGADGATLSLDEYPAIRALRGERVERFEAVFRRPDGSEIPIEVHAAPIPDQQVPSAVVVWQDITNVKVLERLRAEWNSVVAHDLRQPINTIGIYAQLLSRAGDQLPPSLLAHVAEIRKMISRLTRMTNDLLDLSRLDASRLTVERRPLDLGECVREAVARVALESSARKFDVRVDGGPFAIDGDPDRLAQVMENLLSNAVKYGRPERPIRIRVERSSEGVAVSVTSEGEGLQPEHLARLFQRFQRAGVASHRAVPGIGLGLQITQGLIEAHGGHIAVTSTPGADTTFRFTLPVRGEPHEPG